MKHLIINADDFGYSPGVNKGIIESHLHGVVTSTSVMVDAVAAEEASKLSDYPELAVGLHFVPSNNGSVEEELDRQIKKFISITGSRPTHIDIHKVRENDLELKRAVNDYAKRNDYRARYSRGSKFINSFFGPHADGDVSIDRLKKAVGEATEDINEIMCHVGYADDYLLANSSYNLLREQELTSVCSKEVMAYIHSLDLELGNWLTFKPITNDATPE